MSPRLPVSVSIFLRYRHRGRIIHQVNVEDARRHTGIVHYGHLGIDPVDLESQCNTPSGGDGAKAAVDCLTTVAGALAGDHGNISQRVGQHVGQGGIQRIRWTVVGDGDGEDDLLAVHTVGHADLEVSRDHAADVHAGRSLGLHQGDGDGVLRGLHPVSILRSVDLVATSIQSGEGVGAVRSGGEGLQLRPIGILELNHYAGQPAFTRIQAAISISVVEDRTTDAGGGCRQDGDVHCGDSRCWPARWGSHPTSPGIHSRLHARSMVRRWHTL